MIIQRLVLPVSLVAALVFVPGCKKEREPAFFESSRKGTAEVPVKDVPQDILTTQQAFINLVKKVNPAVVNISTISKKKMVRPFFEISPFFDDFFGDGMSPPQYRRDKSLGSGFIINGDGYIVTNDHVIRDAESIQVKLSNDHVYPAKVIGSDAKTDLAIIKISVKDKLPYAVLGDSDKLQVGQWAVAIGNPFGLDRTVTVGVISATGRSDMGIETYEDFIQTDASINPGNSGGPLLNVYGEVIGINTAIVAAGQGIGFAIPINMAKQVVAQLMTKGNVTRGWLGVSIQPVMEPIARSFGLKEVKGVVISDVMRGSPALKAGIRQGDVLLTFDGKEIKDARQLQRVVAETAVGRKAEVQVFRDGKVVKLQVVLGSSDSADALQQRPEIAAEDLLGISVSELSPDLQRRGATGVVVTEVDPAGIAAEGGLQRGDIVQSINQRRVANVADYTKAMRDADKKGVAAILVRRGDASLYFAFNLR